MNKLGPAGPLGPVNNKPSNKSHKDPAAHLSAKVSTQAQTTLGVPKPSKTTQVKASLGLGRYLSRLAGRVARGVRRCLHLKNSKIAPAKNLDKKAHQQPPSLGVKDSTVSFDSSSKSLSGSKKAPPSNSSSPRGSPARKKQRS